ncbi:hypothetical protein PVAND_000419 [Polypedilum vanderplanki]|uniref:Caspase n=1 Tax=Polypedilum vanderplanki TaxID=319348 RepID=A0A9J6BJS4_POLVA|nr:hypothetical protein PVAND_000419 [Polypedilum vanderplanki]
MDKLNQREEIDEIMEEMEARTPKSTDVTKKFEEFSVETIKIDSVDAKTFNSSNFFSSLIKERVVVTKPGLIHPSRPTNERYYDYTHKNIGTAVIFNQCRFPNQEVRKGSLKDANDLKNVLEEIGFQTEIFTDFTTKKIRQTLETLARQDHSDNDCLLITIMTHGENDGRIYSSDGKFSVDELWEKFLGENCKSLVGKPKLFFIQACRGTMTDPGTLLKQKPKLEQLAAYRSDAVDSKPVQKEEYYVIPSLADVLIMYSTAEGYYSFRNPTDGSWFIQALCEELRENSHEELMTILTGVNRRVAFAKQSYIPNNYEYDASKQMPVIQSMLTKSLYFLKKDQKLKINLTDTN